MRYQFQFARRAWFRHQEQSGYGLPVLGRTARNVGALGLLCAASAFSQSSVVTWHNDNARTGQNVNEVSLTPANVNSSQFGKLFSVSLDGHSYTQPLYLPNLSIGGATHNVVFATTEHDTVYAFDADTNGGSNALPLWKASLLDSAHGAAAGATAVTDQSISSDIVPEYGITGTPVIDPASGTLYVVSFTQESSTYVQRLHALDVKTGAEKFSGPVKIQASVPGTGNGSSGGVLSFDPKWDNQRPALALQNGIVYVTYAAHGDNGPWHGWILGYKASTLAQAGVYCPSPNGFGSGIWMSGAGPAMEIIDAAGHPFGRMFVAMGNGDSNVSVPYTSQMSYGEAHVNFDLTNGQPKVTDQFTTSQWSALNGQDGDVGAGGVVLLPDQGGPVKRILVQAGKSGIIYVINRDNMGGYSQNSDNVLQEISNQIKGMWATPAYWNNRVYFWGVQDNLKAFLVNNGVVSSTPASKSVETYDYPGSTPSISANGTNNGIVWTLKTDGYGIGAPAILQARDALNVATLLYSSDQNEARDIAGPAVKFQVPTVVNGKVYVAGQKLLSVYGLLNGVNTTATPVFSPGSETIPASINVTITDSTPGATIYYTTDGTQPTQTSTRYAGPIKITSTQTINAIASANGYLQSATASASYKLSTQADAPVISPPPGSYTTAQTVQMSDTTSNAKIYYTLDGSTPTASSTAYTGSFSIGASTTVKAIAIAAGFSNSPITTASYVIQQNGTSVDFSTGFSQSRSVMTFNGSTLLDDSRLQLTNGGKAQQGSAFYNTPLPVTGFTTDFVIQLSNPVADGMTFTIQGNSPTAIGGTGSSLGYQGIGKSIAIKFDLYNSAGEGGNSTGLYTNGAAPTLPAIDLTPSGIDLHSDHNMPVHITYDGATLKFTITDSVTSKTYSTSWAINLPQIVGGNTAYFGFTGGTGGGSASQKVLTWTYLSSSGGTNPTPAATPAINPPGGNFSTQQSVMISDTTAGATIYYTTDGSTPTASSQKYTSAITVTSTETIKAIATAPNFTTSAVAGATFTIVPVTTSGSPSYGSGFTSTGMTLNGGANITNGVLRLTDYTVQSARSAFFSTPVPIGGFVTDFTFQLTNATADGFAFVIQNQGPTAVGSSNAGLGFGPNPGGTNTAIAQGVALKFDLWNNLGEGSDSVGVYTSGVPLTLPAKDLTNTGIDLHSGHVFAAHVTGDSSQLTLQLTDKTTGTSFVKSFPISIASAVGGSTAYVGFTGSTGGFTALQDILTWTFTPASVNYAGGFTATGLTLNGGAGISNGALQVANGAGYTAMSAFTTAKVPVQAFTTDFSFQMPQSDGDGFTFVLQSAGPNALGPLGQALGYGGGAGQPGIASSVALKFDLVNNVGEGINSTGVYINGALPTLPATDLTPSGVNLHSGNTFKAHVTYDGVNLSLTLTDTVTKAVFTGGFPVNIPQIVGGPNAYVGFTGGTGAASAIINILNWTLTPTVTISGTSAYGTLGVIASGGATVTNGVLQLTDGGAFETRSAFTAAPTSISTFSSAFDFQLTNAVADGFTFVIQNQGPTALGQAGGGLGYGQSNLGATPVITPSVAIKFDLYDNAGEGAQSTGIYMNGATPTVPAVSLAGSGIDLHSGHVFHTTISYDGTNLTLTITDTTTKVSYTHAFPVNLVSTLGSSSAFLGFTGATGGATAIQNILNWTINSGTLVNYASGFTAAGLTTNGSAHLNGNVLELTDGGQAESASAFTSAAVPVQQFSTAFNFQMVNASADGFAFLIQGAGPTAIGGVGGGLGFAAVTPGGSFVNKSVAVKFDLFNNAGEGGDSTGIYLNGALPTVPAVDMSASGINLHGGNLLNAQLTYDGAHLTMVLTDTATSKAFSTSFPVNIPSVVGGNTAYVGFTAGTGGLSATQNILNWTFAGLSN